MANEVALGAGPEQFVLPGCTQEACDLFLANLQPALQKPAFLQRRVKSQSLAMVTEAIFKAGWLIR